MYVSSFRNGWEKSDDEVTSIASSNHEPSVSQCCSPRPPENVENVANGVVDAEVTGKGGENNPGPLHHRRSSSFAYTLEIPTIRGERFVLLPKFPFICNIFSIVHFFHIIISELMILSNCLN